MDLAPAPFVHVEHAQKFAPGLQTAPTPLDLSGQVLALAECAPGLNATCPALQLTDGPQGAWSRPSHMLLDGGVETFKKDQEIHGIHEEVQHAIALGVDKSEALCAHQLLSLLVETSSPNVRALVAHWNDIDL